MAVTFSPIITGQDTSSTLTYAYLFESLLTEGEAQAGEAAAFFDIKERNPEDKSLVNIQSSYASFLLDASGKVEFDAMKILRQRSQSQWYKIGSVTDIDWKTIVTPYYYDLDAEDEQNIVIFPIIGGRNFRDFVPTVDDTQVLNEWEAAGETMPQFKDFPYIQVSLADLTDTDIRPTVTITTPTTGEEVCGAFLLWKSKYGGWCGYGFDVVTESKTHNYLNPIERSEFSGINGVPYMPVNYTQVESSDSMSLKKVGVNKIDVNALQGMKDSPAVYLMRDATSSLELVRLTSFAAPITNLAEGSNVDITVSSISKLTQNVM